MGLLEWVGDFFISDPVQRRTRRFVRKFQSVKDWMVRDDVLANFMVSSPSCKVDLAELGRVALRDPDVRVRRKAALLIATTGGDERHAWGLCGCFCGLDFDAELMDNASKALVSLKEKSVEPLCELVSGEFHLKLRQRIASQMSKEGLAALAESERRARAKAALVLWTIGDKRAIPALRQALSGSSGGWERHSIAKAFVHLAEEAGVRELQELNRTADDELRNIIQEALEEHRLRVD